MEYKSTLFLSFLTTNYTTKTCPNGRKEERALNTPQDHSIQAPETKQSLTPGSPRFIRCLFREGIDCAVFCPSFLWVLHFSFPLGITLDHWGSGDDFKVFLLPIQSLALSPFLKPCNFAIYWCPTPRHLHPRHLQRRKEKQLPKELQVELGFDLSGHQLVQESAVSPEPPASHSKLRL